MILPLAFISDVFVVSDQKNSLLNSVGNFFPLKPFVNAFQDCFSPIVDGPAFNPGSLAFVAAWGLFGLAIALKKFRWEPSGSAPRGRRSRAAAVEAAG